MEEGKRFSLVYLEPGAPLRDSQRFRNRLSAYYWANLDDHRDVIQKLIHKETGAKIPVNIGGGYMPNLFFERGELRDVLDSITLVYEAVADIGYRTKAENWKTFVERALREENVGYRLDPKCGVHFFVDEEFERNCVATLSALDASELSGVLDAYEAAYRHMDSDPPDTKAAVRSMFESLEILVRQMVPAKNLYKKLVETALKQKCLPLYAGEPTAAQVVTELFDGFADWVNALHNYRHGQPSEQPVAPTMEVAVYVLSSGSAFLRWLVGINNDLSKT
ncbi:MAG: hypothetical protein E6J74_23755 [Deltaproteobacteria bacterium]|nr:MAG: hypothetical protein E6J74_23755 [Deltaproteobacteria bacterium]